ncbi:MAG TPA: SAM-dependent methyltransferase [Burkholderiaceae bacterium]|nr:SAM-dependent methyltransferase [Burkholderiaceae bacterium]
MSRLPTSLPDPEPFAAAHGARVAACIHGAIDAAGGWIGFDRFMELALYAPGLGYYVAGAAKFGPAGDFVTAPEISPLFGRAIANQVAELVDRLARDGGAAAVRILEFGAGTGALAGPLIDEMQRLGVAFGGYLIVETSPDLRQRQQERLGTRPVRWLDAPPEGFCGVIIANEVLDVMPVRLFVRRSDGVRERGVALRDGRLAFEERPAPPDLARAVADIERECGPWAAGYGSEVGFLARAWMRSLAGWLQRGAALLVDYGFPARELYHPQRLMGTLMCHFRHRAHADPLWWPGLNDITAHVDFSAMAAAADEAGLDVLGYTSQAHFLLNCGILDLMRDDAPAATRSGVHRVVSEAEMGELLKVLAVGRGIGGDALRGFARGDRTHRL